MAENQAKRSVTPGLVKSEDYQKQKVYIVNPTLQVVTEELPTAEKSVIFTEHLAETIAFASWIPPEGELKLTPEMIAPDVTLKEPEKPKKAKKTVTKTEKIKNQKFEKRVKVKTPTEMEILNQTAMLNDVKEEIKQPKFEEIKMEIPKVIEQPKVKKPTEMEIINKVQKITPGQETAKIEETETIMFVDNIAVKLAKNSNNTKCYMFNNKTVTREEVVKFTQSISGKILAMDCKRIEIKGIKYTLQGMSYKGSDGKTLSIDNMLELVHI